MGKAEKPPRIDHHACPQCDYKTWHVGHLNAHVRTVHEKRRDHACPQCNAAFGEASTLRNHVRAVHEQRKDHACSQCDAAFGKASNLSRHVHNSGRDGCVGLAQQQQAKEKQARDDALKAKKAEEAEQERKEEQRCCDMQAQGDREREADRLAKRQQQRDVVAELKARKVLRLAKEKENEEWWRREMNGSPPC